jgi:hypothetical protein
VCYEWLKVLMVDGGESHCTPDRGCSDHAVRERARSSTRLIEELRGHFGVALGEDFHLPEKLPGN